MARSSRRCPVCDASAVGCTSLQVLAGRTCCTGCPGDHDAAPVSARRPKNSGTDEQAKAKLAGLAAVA